MFEVAADIELSVKLPFSLVGALAFRRQLCLEIALQIAPELAEQQLDLRVALVDRELLLRREKAATARVFTVSREELAERRGVDLLELVRRLTPVLAHLRAKSVDDSVGHALARLLAHFGVDELLAELFVLLCEEGVLLFGFGFFFAYLFAQLHQLLQFCLDLLGSAELQRGAQLRVVVAGGVQTSVHPVAGVEQAEVSGAPDYEVGAARVQRTAHCFAVRRFLGGLRLHFSLLQSAVLGRGTALRPKTEGVLLFGAERFGFRFAISLRF